MWHQKEPEMSEITDISLTLSMIRRRMEDGAKEVQGITNQGRLALKDPVHITRFRSMFPVLDKYFAKVEAAWDKLLDLALTAGEKGIPTEKDQSLFDTAKRYYYESRLIESNLSSQTSLKPSDSATLLPRAPLPHFDGELQKWPRYRDTFISMVDSNSSLSDLTKFHYLTTSLSGAAVSKIAHLPLLASNYSIAWAALVKAYDNKRLLAISYLNALVDGPVLSSKPDSNAINDFLARISENSSALKKLEINDLGDFILFYLSFRLLDPTSREQFENQLPNDTEFPPFQSLTSFLETRGRSLHMSDARTLSAQGVKSNPLPSRRFGTRVTLLTGRQSPPLRQNKSSETCFVCKLSHKLIECPTFVTADPEKRRALLKGYSGCYNCLAPHHMSYSCPSKNRCRLCQRSHHTMLHTSQSAQSSSESPKIALSAMVNSSPKVLLGTAVALFRDVQNKPVTARLLVDCGSQTSLITSRLHQKLDLPMLPISQTVLGIGQIPFQGVKGKVSCQLSSCYTNDWGMTCEALVVDTITSSMPNFSLSESNIEPYLSYQLADPRFWKSSEIDFLLGADLFPQILSGTSIKLQENGPWLVSSTFGHLIIGNVPSEEAPSSNVALVADAEPVPTSNDDLDRALRQFWEIEENPATTCLLDEAIEHLFSSTVSRNEDGRYMVCLPWRESPPNFGNCFPMAWKRLLSLETKLSQNPSFRKKYSEFMTEYFQLGHMAPTSTASAYLLPHHGILKKGKIRVVFDASARVPRGSLNSELLIGPKLQKDIRAILMNFRRHTIVLVADIVKMYRQILIHPEHRPYQHILWRDDTSQPVQTYELTTLTYGMSCAPYLAQRVLQQLVQDEGHDFPLASQSISDDMYMDDIVTGCDSEEDATELKQQLIAMMKRGGFELDKWMSNLPTLIPHPHDETSDFRIFTEPSDSLHKILGLQWDSNTDSFSYEISLSNVSETKRGLLSFIARIYDPLGLLAPIIVCAKSMIQDLWKAGLGWDEDVSPEIRSRFRTFVSELPLLAEIMIPRQILPSKVQSVQILGFSDASQIAYCAALYLRAQSSDGQITISLITAKTRLAPLKVVSIPRLELCAALLLSRTYLSILDFLKKLPGNQISPVFFSDSKIVLHWLRTPAYRLKTFVANRVTEILTTTSPDEWRHVKGKENPSDLGSRGLLPSKLINDPLWWQGPPWLLKHPSFWPNEILPRLTDLPEMKDDVFSLPLIHTMMVSTDWMERFSKLTKLIRVVSWIKRFGNNCRRGMPKRTGPITLTEYNSSKEQCIRVLQLFHFFGGNEANSEKIPHDLRQLRPFLDKNGLLRVGGRLSNANLDETRRHPILIPQRCHFALLLVDHYHHTNLHPGPGLLQALIQRCFWIPGLRALCRKRVFKCIRCYRLVTARKDQSPVMADLPSPRVNISRVFENCGVDFAGPFLMRSSLLRKAPQIKVYICLFVCLATKALHLEAVSDLSTDAFFASLNRFISRRGCPTHMYSDCGTNFQGCARQLREWYKWYSDSITQSNIVNFTNSREINWHFNPPHSPHFGGLWEAGVKSVKSILRKIVGEQALTFEEWATILCRIEALLNSRPLCPLSSAPDENDCLTPAHFLIGSSMMPSPEPNLEHEPVRALTRWQLLNHMTQHFWKRWSLEYLSTLQKRNKWTKDRPNPEVGDLVLLKEKTPPLKWPLARILSLHPGKDGVVRVVTLKTGTSTFVRPVHLLVPFPPDSKASS